MQTLPLPLFLNGLGSVCDDNPLKGRGVDTKINLRCYG